jgi:SAM-dependent methyltransferase
MSASDLYEDARLYDLVAERSADYAFYGDLAQARGGTALELACGTGRVASRLAQRGVYVEGVDLSAAMIARAKDRFPALRWHVGDMRRVDLGTRFGLVYTPFNSLLHLHTVEDLRGYFATVRRHLAPGGALAFDCFNPAPSILARDPKVRFPVGSVYDPVVGETLTVEETTHYDAARQTSRTRWFYSYPSRPDAHVFDLDLRCLFPEEIRWVLAANGFQLVSRHGGLEGEPFDASSRWQAIVAEPV